MINDIFRRDASTCVVNFHCTFHTISAGKQWHSRYVATDFGIGDNRLNL